MFYKFTESANRAMGNAKEEAYKLSHNYVGTEHLLMGLVRADGLASKVLTEHGVTIEKLQELIKQIIAPSGNISTAEAGRFTQEQREL